MMLRIKNLHTAGIDGIASKAEGVMPDNKHVRAMEVAGMIEVLGVADAQGPGAPSGSADTAPVSEVREMSASFDRAYAAQGEHLDRVRAQLAQVSADRDDIAARLEAAERALAQAIESAPKGDDKSAEKAPKGKDKG